MMGIRFCVKNIFFSLDVGLFLYKIIKKIMAECSNVGKCTKGHDDFLSFLVVLKCKTRKIFKVMINFCFFPRYKSVVVFKHISPTHVNQQKIIRIDTPASS